MVVPTVELLSPVFRTYLGCSSALVLKMWFMSGYTSYLRRKTLSFVNPEDAAVFKKELNVKLQTNDKVERVRRAHLNDIENIPLFFVSGCIYTLTNPCEKTARILFLTYTASRFAHTLVYAICVVPQPARALSFCVGTLIIGYMSVKSLLFLKSF